MGWHDFSPHNVVRVLGIYSYFYQVRGHQFPNWVATSTTDSGGMTLADVSITYGPERRETGGSGAPAPP